MGDEIAVFGTLKNYKGTIEFDKGCTLVGSGDIVSQAANAGSPRLRAGGRRALMSKPSVLTGVIVRHRHRLER